MSYFIYRGLSSSSYLFTTNHHSLGLETIASALQCLLSSFFLTLSHSRSTHLLLIIFAFISRAPTFRRKFCHDDRRRGIGVS